MVLQQQAERLDRRERRTEGRTSEEKNSRRGSRTSGKEPKLDVSSCSALRDPQRETEVRQARPALWNMHPRRNKVLGLASSFLEPLCQMSQAGKEVRKLSPDTRKGNWRKTSVMKHLESQEPEELAIFIQTRRTDTGRHQKELASLMGERVPPRR